MTVISEKFLFVDDDINILNAFKRQYHGKLNLTLCDSPEKAIKAFKEEGPFAVVISDMNMTGMNGATLLKKLKDIDTKTIRIMLTGQSDAESAIRAVNEGEVFRILLKPCPTEEIGRALVAGLEQYRLQQVE